MSQPPPYGDWPDPQQQWQADRPPGEVPTQMGYPAASYGTPAAPPGYGYPVYAYPAAAPTNGMAIAALVCSLAGLAVGISAPVGAILGHIARRQIRERGEQGDGMALTGIIVGWVLTGIYLVCCVGYISAVGFAISQDSSF
jgi:Domain of unknown function (DUF4190)